MKIVGCGWILSGMSSKSDNFLWTAPRLQTVGPCARFGRWFWKLVELGKVYCIVCWTELCYANRGAFFFHETCQFWSAPTETLSRVFRFYLAFSGMMPAYSCNIICWTHPLHLRLFTGQLMAVLISATWWPTTAHMSVLRQSSLLLKLYCYRICKHSSFKSFFHNW